MSAPGLRRAVGLEVATLGWNVVGAVALAFAAVRSGSTAITGFGADTVIEIAASTVVIWELREVNGTRRDRATKLIGVAFLLLAVFLVGQSSLALVTAHHPRPSTIGLLWVIATALVMFVLAAGKRQVGRALANPVVQLEARVTLIDAILASAVVIGLLLDQIVGWWWADALTGLVIASYAAREAASTLGRGSAGVQRPSRP